MTRLEPSPEELAKLESVRNSLRDAIQVGTMIPFETLPDTECRFVGHVAEFRYQFEGEEDLLHLIVERCDKGALTPEEGQAVAGFVLNGMNLGLVRLTPGHHSQHFYFGHEDLMQSLKC